MDHIFLLGTGSRPCEVSIPGLAQAGYFTSDTILDLRTQPGSLIVLGGGAVALELGQFFARLGTRITILQRGQTLLSEMDEDVGRALETALIDEGIEVVTDAQLLRMTHDATGKRAWVMKDGREQSVAAYNATHSGRPAKEIDHRLDTEVVFTDPQVAVVGLNEAVCRTGGISYLTASYPFADHGKALGPRPISCACRTTIPHWRKS